MKQVAHQAVVMQFILEVASHSQQDPRGCFRQFFHKAKVGQRISGGGGGGLTQLSHLGGPIQPQVSSLNQ